jgi:hypothetical protein
MKKLLRRPLAATTNSSRNTAQGQAEGSRWKPPPRPPRDQKLQMAWRVLAVPVCQGRHSRAEMGLGEKNKGGGRQDKDGEGGHAVESRRKEDDVHTSTHGTESNWLSRINICLLASCRRRRRGIGLSQMFLRGVGKPALTTSSPPSFSGICSTSDVGT